MTDDRTTPLERIHARVREIQKQTAAKLAKAESEGRLRREVRAMPYYGVFPGGDPRKFTPDPECSTAAERANWRQACDEADANETFEKAAQCSLLGDGSNARGTGFGLGSGTQALECLILTHEDGREEEYV